MGLDDCDAFGDVSCVGGELLFAEKGAFLGNCGSSVSIGVADRVEEAVVLVLPVLACRVIEKLLLCATVGWGSVAAASNVLEKEFLSLVGVAIKSV